MVMLLAASYFDTVNWQDAGAIAALFALVAGAVLWIANKIFKFGTISQRLSSVENAIKDDLKPGLQNIADKLHDIALSVNSNAVTQSNSPRILNPDGEKILRHSGVQKLMDDRFDDIVEKFGLVNLLIPIRLSRRLSGW
jgi:hypothetical protein